MPKIPTSPATISIVVPSYNQGKYLGTTLDSLYFQDYPNIELIIVDDCSTDNSPQVIAEFLTAMAEEEVSFASNFNSITGEVERTYHKRYNRSGRTVRVIHNETNLGATTTYNKGLQEASGDYCSFVVSDDICHPQMLSRLAAALEQGYDFAYSDVFIVDDAHRVLREFRFPDYDFEACFGNWYLMGVSTLYRRELHDRFGWYPDKVSNDHALYQRFALGGARMVHVPEVLYSIRSHHQRKEGLHTSEGEKRMFEESKRLVTQARAALAKMSVPKQADSAKQDTKEKA